MIKKPSQFLHHNMDLIYREADEKHTVGMLALQTGEFQFYSNNTLVKSDFMDGIKALTCFTHLFSYLFNLILFYSVFKSNAITTKVYITHMICVEILLNICQHFSVEYVLETEDQSSIYVFKMVCIMFMTVQMWTVNTIRYFMTFMMAVNRFICSIHPRFNKYFESETVALFGIGVWMLAFIGSWYLLLVGCFPKFNTETFALETNCDYFEWPDFVYKSHYLLVMTLILNIMMVAYAKLRRWGCFKVAVARVSVVAANRRSRNETYFVIQSFIVFIVMAYDATYTFLRKHYEPQFNSLPSNLQISLGWFNIYSPNYINFLIYFVFHKANRILVLRTIFFVHSRVYMFNMIVSEILMNLSQNLLIEFPYFFPQDPKFYSFRSVKIIEIVSQMAYQAKFFLAILMATNRVWVIWRPIGSEAFSSERLRIYMIVGWIILFFRQMIIIIPDDCYFKMDLVQFQVMAVCEDVEKHAVRMRINSSVSYFIHIVLPWASVAMNIVVFAVIKIRKQKSQIYRSSGEKSLVINSLVVSLLLTANYLYNYFYSMFKPKISQQSHEFQSLFSFFNLYGCSCFNFVVYFVLDPTNRKNFINTITNKKPTIVAKTVTTML